MAETNRSNSSGRNELSGLKVILLIASAFLVVALALLGYRVYQRASLLSQRNPVVATFSPDGQRLAVSVGHGTYLYSTTGYVQQRYLDHAQGGTDFGAAFSPEGSALAQNRTLWNTSDGTALLSLNAFEVFSLAYSPDGKQIASYSLGGIDVFNLPDGSKQAHMDAAAGCSCQAALAFTPDGRIVSFGNNVVTIWKASDGEQLSTWKREGPLNAVALSQDGSLLAAGSQSVVEIWDVNQGKQIGSLADNPGTAALLSFSPDGKQLAVGLSNLKASDSLAIWDVSSGKLLHVFPLKGRIASLTYNGMHDQLAAGDYNGSVTVWNTSNDQTVKVLTFTDWQALLISAARDTLPFLGKQ